MSRSIPMAWLRTLMTRELLLGHTRHLVNLIKQVEFTFVPCVSSLCYDFFFFIAAISFLGRGKNGGDGTKEDGIHWVDISVRTQYLITGMSLCFFYLYKLVIWSAYISVFWTASHCDWDLYIYEIKYFFIYIYIYILFDLHHTMIEICVCIL